MAARISPPTVFLLLSIFLVVSQFNNAVAVVVRAHKIEPFLPSSLIAGFLTPILLFTLVTYFGEIGVALTMISVSTFIGLPVALHFKAKYISSERLS